ncbi:phosphoserine phosphatase SerB [Candidatus Liberibacter asiaticus]|uniref:phosphoserine phosphatase SerB n=1 Tax=Liberibacter asiaticus TaxID=34021 RepID=UPI00070259DC|nr:phosphoserine phosphatase SerB [Candidatus Liberibacter asiaticus]AWL14315.1 phosphoserine phosphatase SerB [Candidatus Liberibacter asiaticus]KAE9518354.1 Phosphoserine phosphatase [Candidatus Liberibacter asiaticus]KRF68516.1 phosphoserine phosphatase [Candidatus Liberibacter asiaticus]MBE2996844.1 phosphoserine phosphatase SerB [Candidatus Liberibacter asiaticus]MCU7489605.1 phosphoserine phosphatase SerB [Candidatus Liberibacter asiaticus]
MALIATLITHRSHPILNISLVKQIMQIVNSSIFYWLADSIACDIILPLEGMIDHHRSKILSIIADKPIDLIIHRHENRRKNLLIADMDSTMIEQECIDELADLIGIKEKVSLITARAMNGEIPFQDSLRERISLFKGTSTKIIDSLLEKKITYNPGGYELVHTMKQNGASTLLVTGGFSIFARFIAQHLGFDQYYANRFIEKDDRLTGQVMEPIIDGTAKSQILLEAIQKLQINPEDTIAVGDVNNDLDMLRVAGYGVAFHAKPALAKQAKIRIDHSDLEALLYIQGYKKDEIVKSP